MNNNAVLRLAGILHVNVNVSGTHGSGELGGVLGADANAAPGSDIVFIQQCAGGDIVGFVFVPGRCGSLRGQLIGGALLYVVNNNAVPRLANIFDLDGQAVYGNAFRSVADKLQSGTILFQCYNKVLYTVVGCWNRFFRYSVVYAIGKRHGFRAILSGSLIGGFFLSADSEHSAFQRVAVPVHLHNSDGIDGFWPIDILNSLLAFFHVQPICSFFEIIFVKIRFAHFSAVDYDFFQLIAIRCFHRRFYRIGSLGKFCRTDKSISDRLCGAGYARRKAGRGDLQRADFNHGSRNREGQFLFFSIFVLIG